MSAHDTSRHFVAALRFGRFRGEADMDWRAAQPETGANDPELTQAGSKFRTAASP